MDSQPSSNDSIIAELVSMGFDVFAAAEAVRTEGVSSLADAVEFLLAESSVQSQANAENTDHEFKPAFLASSPNEFAAFKSENVVSQDMVDISSSSCHNVQKDQDGRKVTDPKTSNAGGVAASSNSWSPAPLGFIKGNHESSGSLPEKQSNDLQTRAEAALRKHFGYSELKPFQLEALKAWEANQDCLVLAATGSGKSLCFQLPALLTGKVVVVISPLISLMHDQCLQLSRRNISACFLGSAQGDKNVEKKAMTGMYSIVYVCPETLPRLMNSLKELACKHGIALFAIDEAHCISKWGHDFRPDYRRLFVLRESFHVRALPGLKDPIPILALTATATDRVQTDILNSLQINSSQARVVRMTLFRPNLRFSVCHSKTCRPSSYEKDFKSLIEYYKHDAGSNRNKLLSIGNTNADFIPIASQKNKVLKEGQSLPYWAGTERSGTYQVNANMHLKVDNMEMEGEDYNSDDGEVEECEDEDEDEFYEDMSAQRVESMASCNKERQELTVSFLEDDEEDEVERLGGDFEVSWKDCLVNDPDAKDKSISSKIQSPEVERGPSIVYMPTRKETEAVAKFLTQSGVKSAPYHAKLSKGHLRGVHDQFHRGTLEVVVATIAFGMGIDKSNVRHIIHYGWPQSLEAYYQEAGRAGRDGLLSDCILYCDMTMLPSLLPSRRDPEQTQHALSMLDQCFRYGLSTDKCRAKTLLGYFGEDLADGRCTICDVCSFGPPPLENLTKEAEMLLSILSGSKKSRGLLSTSNQIKRKAGGNGNYGTFQEAVDEIIKHDDIAPRNRLWWRGFGRVLMDGRLLKETNRVGRFPRKLVVPHVRNAEVTAEGENFLDNCDKNPTGSKRLSGNLMSFCIHPQGDMVQAMLQPEKAGYWQGGTREWGRGWADPEIRKQRLSRLSKRKPREKRQSQRRDRGAFKKQRQSFRPRF